MSVVSNAGLIGGALAAGGMVGGGLGLAANPRSPGKLVRREAGWTMFGTAIGAVVGGAALIAPHATKTRLGLGAAVGAALIGSFGLSASLAV